MFINLEERPIHFTTSSKEENTIINENITSNILPVMEVSFDYDLWNKPQISYKDVYYSDIFLMPLAFS